MRMKQWEKVDGLTLKHFTVASLIGCGIINPTLLYILVPGGEGGQAVGVESGGGAGWGGGLSP